MTTAAAKQRRYRHRKNAGLGCWQIELPAGLAEDAVWFVQPDADLDNRREVERKLSEIITHVLKNRYR